MGSASREALAQARTVLQAGLARGAGTELLQASGQIAANSALAAALGDASADAASKTQLAERLFGGLSADARRVLGAAVSGRWSNVEEFVAGVEELGLRAEALENTGLSDELLAVADVIDRNHELQLTVGSKLVEPAAKATLIKGLFDGEVSGAALAVVTHLVANLRGRRLDGALRSSARVIADQSGSELATVTVAAPLSAQQQGRLTELLERITGRPVKITTVVDPEIVGGIRVQIADDVIDGSVSTRLADLRSKLAA